MELTGGSTSSALARARTSATATCTTDARRRRDGDAAQAELLPEGGRRRLRARGRARRCSRRSTRRALRAPRRRRRRAVDRRPRSRGLEGPARAVLTGERIALNLVGRLSRHRDADAPLRRPRSPGTGATILDTRKTTPGLRALEKYAVRCGGGRNHRFGLYDGILVKENHLRRRRDRLARGRAARAGSRRAGRGRGRDARRGRRGARGRRRPDPARQHDPARCSAARSRSSPAAPSSRRPAASPSTTVRAIAETGVDFISVGALTHSARSLDVSLEVL